MRPETSTPVVVLTLFHHCALGIVRSLGRLGVSVYGIHDDPAAPPTRSRYVRTSIWPVRDEEWSNWQGGASPPADRALEFLSRFVRDVESRPILVPTDDIACAFVEDNASVLGNWFLFPEQPPGVARALSSKKGMYELCAEHDIPTPETRFPVARDEVVEFAAHAQFPVVLKGIDAWLLVRRSGVRMLIVDSPHELLERYDELETPGQPNLMLQEYIPGGEDSVWFFNGYFNARSECLLGFTGRKLRQYPPYTGMASLAVCLENPEVAEQTKRFMGALGYRGILDIGYRYDARDGQYKLLDVNPRIGATFRLFVTKDGLDVVRALYLDLTGQPVAGGGARNGRKWMVEDYDVGSSLAHFRDGTLGFRDWAASLRGVEELAYFARDDLRPLSAMLRRATRLALARRASRPKSM